MAYATKGQEENKRANTDNFNVYDSAVNARVWVGVNVVTLEQAHINDFVISAYLTIASEPLSLLKR